MLSEVKIEGVGNMVVLDGSNVHFKHDFFVARIEINALKGPTVHRFKVATNGTGQSKPVPAELVASDAQGTEGYRISDGQMTAKSWRLEYSGNPNEPLKEIIVLFGKNPRVDIDKLPVSPA